MNNKTSPQGRRPAQAVGQHALQAAFRRATLLTSGIAVIGTMLVGSSNDQLAVTVSSSHRAGVASSPQGGVVISPDQTGADRHRRLDVGAAMDLQVSIPPGTETVTWTSSSSDVAEVSGDAGGAVVKAIAEGVATIRIDASTSTETTHDLVVVSVHRDIATPGAPGVLVRGSEKLLDADASAPSNGTATVGEAVEVLAKSRNYYLVMGSPPSSYEYWLPSSAVRSDINSHRESAMGPPSSHPQSAARRRATPPSCDRWDREWSAVVRFSSDRCVEVKWANWWEDSGLVMPSGTAKVLLNTEVETYRGAARFDQKVDYRYVEGWGTATTLNIWMLQKCTRPSKCKAPRTIQVIALSKKAPTETLSNEYVYSVKTKNTSARMYTSIQLLMADTSNKAPVETGGELSSPGVRCDRMYYVGSRGGCVIFGVVPTFIMDGRYTSTYWKSSEFVKEAQDGIPAHPGVEQDDDEGVPLNRWFWKDPALKLKRNPNRVEALKQCKSIQKKGSCDEYPFAATYEGCYRIRVWCRVDRLSGRHNSRAGSAYGQFLLGERLIDGDAFWVWVVE